MDTQIRPYIFGEVKDEQQLPTVREVLDRYIYHWPFFLVCLFISLAFAFLYIRFTDKQYEVKAKVLIRDEKKTPEDQPALKELKLFTDNQIVENEIEFIRSRTLMQQTVMNLKLWISYSEPGVLLTNADLYSRSPIQIDFISGKPDKAESFKVIIQDESKFLLKRKNGETTIISFNTFVKNGMGVWQLQPTEHLKQFIGHEISIDVNTPDKTSDAYLEELNVEQVNKLTSVLELSLKDVVAKRGIDILNELIALYSQTSQAKKHNTTQYALDFIDKRLSSLTGELNQSEKAVEDYRSSQGLTDISSESKVFLENVQANDQLLNEVNIQLNVLDGIERYVNSPEGSGNVPATIGISDVTLVSLCNRLNDLQLQKEKLLATTPEGNPVFETLNRQIRITKSGIKENINGVKRSLLVTRNKLRTYNSGFERSIKKIPGQERQLLDVKRQQSIKENLYVYLLQKREEVALSFASISADNNTIDLAYASDPVWPKKSLIYFISIFFGVAFPAGFVFGRRHFSNKVVDRKEIEKLTKVPVLTELLYEESKSPIVVTSNGSFAIGEQFRSLRTNLHYLHGSKDKGRVTLLTSSIPNEGKSFVACNLGMTLAASGRKTVIVELDLRRPQISKNLNLSPYEFGLSQYLQGDVSKEDIIRLSDVHPNLFVIGAGPLPSNPSELLEQIEIDDLLIWLRGEFDDIIIDTPPLHLVTDAMILARLADLTLYIVRHNYTLKSELQFVEQLKTENKLPNLNFVFNGVHMDRRYGYALNYRYYSGDKKSSSVGNFMATLSTRF